jgi:hypothetical protein
MMKLVVRELTKGNHKITDYFDEAGKKWAEIIKSDVFDDPAALAKWCTSNQIWFEQNCGGRWLGQEVMATSAIAGFYDPSSGWKDEPKANAMRVIQAIHDSQCSLEVKYEAEKAANEYELEWPST